MFRPLYIIKLFYHTSPKCKSSAGKIMKKFLEGKRKKEFNYVPMPSNSSTIGSLDSKKNKLPVNIKRCTMLNKTFMRYISDLMANGENSHEFVGCGIEINRVQITPDFNGVNIFWIAYGSKSDEYIEEILTRNAGILRHELSQLKVMGIVPRLKFIKDKKYHQLAELERRLQKADYGEDHVLSNTNRSVAQLEIFSALDPELRVKLEEVDKHNLEEDLDDIPLMPQNVLGFDHSQVLKRIKESMQKTKAIHRFNASNDMTATEELNRSHEDLEVTDDPKTQRETLRKFLRDRQILRQKMLKDQRNKTRDILNTAYEVDEFDDQSRPVIDSFEEDYVVEDEMIEK